MAQIRSVSWQTSTVWGMLLGEEVVIVQCRRGRAKEEEDDDDDTLCIGGLVSIG